MPTWSRRLVVLLVLAFAAGTVAHGAQAAGAVDGSMGAAGGTSPDCAGCGEEDGGTAERTCTEPCVAPGLAVLPAAAGLAPAVVIDTPRPSSIAAAGKSGPPDPDPPRPA